jgi:hypothetical protein
MILGIFFEIIHGNYTVLKFINTPFPKNDNGYNIVKQYSDSAV